MCISCPYSHLTTKPHVYSLSYEVIYVLVLLLSSQYCHPIFYHCIYSSGIFLTDPHPQTSSLTFSLMLALLQVLHTDPHPQASSITYSLILALFQVLLTDPHPQTSCVTHSLMLALLRVLHTDPHSHPVSYLLILSHSIARWLLHIKLLTYRSSDVGCT